MSARLKMGKEWKETLRMNGPQDLKKGDLTHNVIKARFHQCIKEGNYDEVVNLQAAANAFNGVDHNEKQLVDIVTMYKFKDQQGVVFDIPSGDHKDFLADSSFTLTGTYQHNVEV